MASVFRFIHEKKAEAGGAERRVVEFSDPAIIFGRGGSSHVILPSYKVGTQHAKLTREGGALVVTDLESPTGIRVNGRTVSRAELHSGDVVSLGDIDLRVSFDGDTAEVTWLELMPLALPDGERVARRMRQLRLESYLPSIKAISVVLAAIGVVAWLAYPLSTSSKKQWSSGPISNSHKLIEHDCVKCHAEPFKPVRDQECLACHSMTEHAHGMSDFLRQHRELGLRCAECHMEHNGDHGIISEDSRFCVSCHGNLTALKSGATVENVASFDTHPQFRVSLLDANDVVTRASLDDPKAKDPTPIKFGHKVHLKEGLEGKDGPVTLQCADCHALDKDFKTLKPIDFEQHCQHCHSLGFDERLPNSQVPHGDADAVFPALFAAYSRVVLLGEDHELPNPAKDMQREMPGTDEPRTTPMIEATGIPGVVESARAAERQLFTKTGCFLCHSYREKPEEFQTSVNSHYEIVAPRIPNVWFPAARFSHGAHEEFSCESCHEQARNSKDTADLLLPRKQLCQECHASSGKGGYVRSDCVECHSYHDALGFPAEKKQDIANYLKGLTR